MSTSFAHLHVHTEYSLLDGMSRIAHLTQAAKRLDMHHLAITDHGAMYGVPEFYKTCQKEGIHPIIGMEAYLCDDISVKPKKSNEYHHLLLLAETQQGYQNLIQLCTASHTWGFHYKPRIDKRLLAQHATGLIGTSSCLAGEIPGLLLSGQEQQACEAIRWYQDVFGENNFFLELQEHHDNTSEQTKLNKMLYQLHQEMHIEPIATNDLHYVEHDDHRAHDVLLCVQTGARLAEKDRFHFEGDEYYLRSPQEMYGLFGGAERACSNTVLIAERCNVDPFAKKAGLPSVEVPAAYASDYEWLRTLCLQGIQERFGEMTDEVQQKLDYELNIIAQKGFVPYFLIVWDFVNFARERGIRCSARGSAAGSLVAYTLGITNVDPLRYDLLFERFMNPERADMPDIDMDFADDRREEVIRYVSEKYGYDCVAQMVTFNTMAAKSSIKDVARTLNKPDLATTINGMFTDDTKKLQDVLEDSERLQKLLVADGEAKVLWNYAIALEGTVRSTGTHAAGVVVGNEPLTNFLPMRPKDHKAPDAGSETMYPQQYLEELGLIKFDFLGLSNYTVEDLTVRFVKETRGEEIDIERLPLDPTGDHELDEKRSKAFEVLAAGETTGVFQLESPKMREYIRQLKPTRIEDVTAMVALFRPGPMESIPDFIEAKHGRKKVQYLDPRLQTWLEESYGIIVYQDQVLLIAVNLAGFSWGKVNKFRKALSKKIQHEVEGYKSDFIAGCIKNNVKPHVAERLFELIKPFGGYGFNKAHAASYAVIAYQTAYLKANYPVEYMAAVLTKDMNSAKKIAKDVAECQHLKVQVLPPDINKSTMGFQAEDGKVRFGLLAIKGIGEGPIETILKERTCGGIFTSLIDFCERVALGQSAIETLIKAGAFDAFGERHVLLASVENIVKEGKSQRALRKSGQNTLFGEEIAVDLIKHDAEKIAAKILLSYERDLVGVYLSQHPLALIADLFEKQVTHSISTLTEELQGETVTLAGSVVDLRSFSTKKGDTMCSATLEDQYGQTLPVTVFPRIYSQTQNVWRRDAVLIVKGKVQYRNEEAGLLCDSVERIERAEAEMNRRRYMIYLTIVRSGDSEEAVSNDIMKVQELHALLKGRTGRDQFEIRVVIGDEEPIRLVPQEKALEYTDELHVQLAKIVGESNIRVVPLTA